MTINSSLYKLIVPLFFLLFVASCTSSTPKENKANKQQEDQQLLNIIAKYDNYHLNSSPFNNPEQKGNNAILPDLSPASLAKNHQALNTIYQELKLINSDNLSDDNKINLSVLSYRIKNTLDNYTNKEHYMPLTAESGFHVYISYISEQVQFKKKQDYQDYLSRLAAIPNYFNQQEYWMREGIKAGIVQPKIVLIGFEDSIKAFIKEDVTQSTYYTPFFKYV
jgi:uncharacterized protein (DUF885 family)